MLDDKPKDPDDDFPDETDDSDRSAMEALLAGASTPRDPELGSTVTGVVVQIGSEDIFLDIGAKSEATMARAETLDEEGELSVSVGDSIEAGVVSVGDSLRVSRKLTKGSGKGLEAVGDAYRAGLPVEGRVDSVRKGGLAVVLAGNVKAFCPLSQMDIIRIEDPETMVGRGLEFLIIELEESSRNVVVSRRRLLEQEAAKLRDEARARLVEGAVLSGTVASLQSYGAFIELGGIQGLLHVSEISHQRVADPSDVLSPGAEVQVKVLRIDPESDKISLSMKALADDPWLSATERLKTGTRMTGSVRRVLEFGAFVELVPGIEGLLHVSELAPGKRNADARQLIQEGTSVGVQLLSIDTERRRVSLARVETDDPEETLELAPGALAQGKVERVERFGVFVRLGPGVTGLIPNAEMGTQRGSDHRKDFPPGTPVDVVVLEPDEQGRMRLSRKAAMDSKERAEFEQFKSTDKSAQESRQGFGIMGDALRDAFKKD